MMLANPVKTTRSHSTPDLHDDSRQLKELEALLATAPVDGLNNPRLRQLAEELEDRLTNSLVTRRMARGMKKLYQLLADSAHIRYLTQLLLLLEVADDFRVKLVHPRSGWHGEFHLEGIESNRHLLAELVPVLPLWAMTSVGEVAVAFYAEPQACLLHDADLRMKSPSRIWDCAGPRDFPIIEGLPTAYLGEPSHRLDMSRDRLFPAMTASITIIESQQARAKSIRLAS